MAEEIEETRRELKIQEGFVYQLAETNRELESENATQRIAAADSNDRGRALLRDDSERTTLKGPVNAIIRRRVGVVPQMDLSNKVRYCFIRLLWQHLVLVYRHPMFQNQSTTA